MIRNFESWKNKMNIVSKYEDWILNEKAQYEIGTELPLYVKNIKESPTGTIQFLVDRRKNEWTIARALDVAKYTWQQKKRIEYLLPDDISQFGDYPMFFLEIEKKGIKWVLCKVKHSNASWSEDFPRLVRFDKKEVKLDSLPPQHKFLENLEYKTGEQKFIEKNDPNMLNTDGKKKENPAGTYVLEGINYKLTYDREEAYFNIYEKSKRYNPEDCFSVSASFFLSKQKNLSDAELEVIAKEAGKYIGAAVSVHEGDFEIPWFTVDLKDKNSDHNRYGIASKPSFGPFFTREEAEDHINLLKEQNKKKRLPFDPENLKIEECNEYSRYRLTFAQLIDYVKTFGIDLDLNQFLQQHRGAVSAKKFGFN